MARRILNRKDLRADFEAAERRKQDDEDEADEAPKKRKPAKAPKEPKPKAKPRSRSAKIVRMKVVWGVFNNSNQRVAVYDYTKRKEAAQHAAQLTADTK